MNRHVNNKGFTLIEVIISVAVLGILITPIFSLMNINSKLNDKSRDQIIATSLAESEIEELKFSESIKLGKNIVNKNGFTIESLTEPMFIVVNDDEEAKDEKKLYRITVEIKKDERIIERLLTYKSSLEGSDCD